MTLNGESLWGAICKAVREKLWTPANVEKAGKVVYDAAVKKSKEMTRDQYKGGFADPVSMALIFAGGLLLGSVFGHGVVTRSIVVNVKDSKDVTISGLRVEVSGSGGVSVPITGGVK